MGRQAVGDHRGHRHDRTPAQRAHNRRVGWAAAAYGLLLPTCIYVSAHHLVPAPASWLLALVAGAPVLAIFASWSRYFADETDEYVRAVQIGDALKATSLTMALCVVWGFLQAFDAMEAVKLYWVPAIWLVTLGVPPLIRLFKGAGAD